MRYGKPSRRTFLQAAFVAATVITISTLAMAQGKGKGGGGNGGGEDPATPPAFTAHPNLEYELKLINYPNNEAAASGEALAINESGCAIGTYWTATSATHSWFYNPNWSANQAIDLRDVSNVELPEGARFLVRGLNDTGVAVGGIVYANGDVDGFALDTSTGELQLLPTDPNWDYAVGIQINNNGDVLGRIYFLDGTIGNYLYNPGSEEVEATLEIINVPDVRAGRSHLNHAASGGATVVVGVTDPDGKLFIHPKGGETEITNIETFEPHVNDSGTIFGTKSHTFEVQVRKNKTETVTEERFYRLTDANGLEILDASPVFNIVDMNNSEVAVGRHTETVATESGSLTYFHALAYFADLGVIDIGASVADADKALWDMVFRDGGFSVALAVNNAGPAGQAAGQIIGASDSDASTIFLLTPVLK